MLFITVEVEDTEKEEISLTENKLTFKSAYHLQVFKCFMPFYCRAVGGVDKKTFSVELEFFDEVVPQVKMTIKCF